MNITRQSPRGQSLAEFAISLPILLIILAGLVDIGRAYFVQIAMEDAASEGVSYLLLNPDCAFDDDVTRVGACDAPNNAYFRICQILASQILIGDTIDACETPNADSPLTVTISLHDTDTTSPIVSVSVMYQYRFVTPGISAIADTLTLEANVNDVVPSGT